MVKNFARQHSALADVEMPKGADEELINVQEELLEKCFVRTVVLIKEYGSVGVGIPEGRYFHCGGSDRNICCWTRIQRRGERGVRQSVVDGRRDSEVQEAEVSVANVGVNQCSVGVKL